MPTSAVQLYDVDKEPVSSDDAGRRSTFKLPSPLNTSDEFLDRNASSPNRRISSIVTNGELWSSNSPRMTQPLLASQASGGSSATSPKPTTPTRFEDPLLAMPVFRRSGSSPTRDSACGSGGGSGGGGAGTPPLVLSPALRSGSYNSSNSFSARRSHIDFRRSLPGASPVACPGETPSMTMTARPTSARQTHQRGANSEYGSLDPMSYSPGFEGPASAGPGLGDDDDPITDPDGDTSSMERQGDQHGRTALARCEPFRRHSAFVARCPGMSSSLSASQSRVGGISPPPPSLSTRNSNGNETCDDSPSLQQSSATSWRERARTVGVCSFGGGGAGGGSSIFSPAACEGGLQNQTHAALEQLRGELKSLSMRSLHAGGGTAAAGFGAAAVSSSVCTSGHVVLGGYGSGRAGGSGGGGGGGSPGRPGPGRLSEGQAQVSPSRLSISRSKYTSSSGFNCRVGGGGGSDGGVNGGLAIIISGSGGGGGGLDANDGGSGKGGGGGAAAPPL